MISIIICSRKSNIQDSLRENIAKTIGVEYELVIIDNSKNKYSIFSAYNEGVRRAKYPYLCFMHDDILIHTENWGKKVIVHFKNPKVGVIGVAGSHYLPKLPGSHWSSGISSRNVIHTVDRKTTIEFESYIPSVDSAVNGILLDGLWLCIPEIIMKKVFFDENSFTGFHCYDSDICLQIKMLNLKVNIIFDINIEHFSLGKRDDAWLRNIFILFNKWKKKLPIRTLKLSKRQISQANFSNAMELIDQIRINKFGLLFKVKIWILYLRCNPLTNKWNLIFLARLINERWYFSIKKLVKKNLK